MEYLQFFFEKYAPEFEKNNTIKAKHFDKFSSQSDSLLNDVLKLFVQLELTWLLRIQK